MISAVVLTHNSQQTLTRCLDSLQWCAQIIVVDDCSTDETLHIARQAGATVVQRTLNNDFAAQRNFGLKYTEHPWVLFVDSDEEVSGGLRGEIQSALADATEDVAGFYLRRHDFLFGRWLRHGEIGTVRLLRLARRGSGTWHRAVHEVWQVQGSVKKLKAPLLHYPHPIIGDFLQEINYYSSQNARVFFRKGEQANLGHIVAYPVGKFIHNFVLRAGFRDGVPGLIFTMMMSFHSFLTRAKLYMFHEHNGKT